MNHLKIVLIAFLFNLGNISLSAQTKDSLVHSFYGFKFYKSHTKPTYYIKNLQNKIIVNNLKFVRSLDYSYCQVIDAKNQSYFLDESLEKRNDVTFDVVLPGDVPRYTLSIQDFDNSFIVLKEEISSERNPKTTSVEIARIPKSEADRIFFMNNDTSFRFDANYNSGEIVFFPPTTVFYTKGKQFGIYNDKTHQLYDAIDTKNGAIKITLNSLIGFYGVTKIKYKSIDNYNFYLARFQLPNGKKGFVDSNGREYLD